MLRAHIRVADFIRRGDIFKDLIFGKTKNILLEEKFIIYLIHTESRYQCTVSDLKYIR